MQQVLSEHSLLQFETLRGPESFSWWRAPGPSFHVPWACSSEDGLLLRALGLRGGCGQPLQGPQWPPPSGLMMQESLDSWGLQAAGPGQHEKRSVAAGGSEMLCPLRLPTQKPRKALQGSCAIFLLCLPWVNSEMETQRCIMAPPPFPTIS